MFYFNGSMHERLCQRICVGIFNPATYNNQNFFAIFKHGYLTSGAMLCRIEYQRFHAFNPFQ
jgi:hypothetical protein